MANVPNIINAAANEFSTTLAVGISDVDTSMQLNSVTGLNTGGGPLIVDEGTANEEVIYYESIAGSVLTIATNGRAYAGTSAHAHAAGASVTDILVKEHINGLKTKYRSEHNDDGTHDTTKVATLTAIQTLTNKTLTAPTINNGTITSATITTPTITTPTMTLVDSVPTADGGIGFDRTNENLAIGDGSAGQLVHMGTWTSFVPSWTNLTAGSGTNVGYYCRIGKTVLFRVYFEYGSGSSVGTNPTLTLPVTVATYTGNAIIGTAHYRDASPATNFPGGYILSSGLLQLAVVSGANIASSGLTATAPITWTTGDYINITGSYEAA